MASASRIPMGTGQHRLRLAHTGVETLTPARVSLSAPPPGTCPNNILRPTTDGSSAPAALRSRRSGQSDAASSARKGPTRGVSSEAALEAGQQARFLLEPYYSRHAADASPAYGRRPVGLSKTRDTGRKDPHLRRANEQRRSICQQPCATNYGQHRDLVGARRRMVRHMEKDSQSLLHRSVTRPNNEKCCTPESAAVDQTGNQHTESPDVDEALQSGLNVILDGCAR